MIDKTYENIDKYQDILDVFGYFPTFHDDKIIKYSVKGSNIVITIRTSHNEVNSLHKKGYHEILTEFKFKNIQGLKYNFNRRERSILGIEFIKNNGNIQVYVNGVYEGATHFDFSCEEIEVLSCKGYSQYRDFESIKELYDSVSFFLDNKSKLIDDRIEIVYHDQFVVEITGLRYFKIIINGIVYLNDVEAQDIWYILKEMSEDLVYYVQYKSYRSFIFQKKERIVDYPKEKIDIDDFINNDKVIKIFDCKSSIK